MRFEEDLQTGRDVGHLQTGAVPKLVRIRRDVARPPLGGVEADDPHGTLVLAVQASSGR